MQKNIAILGSTGSIGCNTLDVLAKHPEKYRVFALTAHHNTALICQQILQFKPKFVVMVDANVQWVQPVQDCIEQNNLGKKTQLLVGEKALCEVATHPEVDMVMAAIVGAAGLASCLAAAYAGKRLLLANKEALVVGGDVFLNAVQQGNAILLPIDSEHSAIFQCLPTEKVTWPDVVEHVILTASGGPFRSTNPLDFFRITPEQACKHPNWNMGQKISVDSATMMNKALEVIEAKYLFGLLPEQIKVVIHPQSVIHSMVQFKDASVLAQMGTPDMRGPIALGLSWPKRIANGSKAVDFSMLGSLTFE